MTSGYFLVSSARAGNRSWVAAQLVLMAAIARAGKSGTATSLGRLAGGALLAAGLGLGAASARALGGALTMYPQPRRDGRLVTTGPFARVRHPIYSAGLIAGVGYSLGRGSRPSLALTGALGLFWDRKASREEALLERRYPGYARYRRQTPRRFIPLVY